MKCNFKMESPLAKLPTRHTVKSAGIDFYAAERKAIFPGDSKGISTGISWSPSDLEQTQTVALIIQSRSGWAFKKGIEASNAGVIDQDYVSTKVQNAVINVKLYNNS